MAKSQIDSVANCPMNGVSLSGRIEKSYSLGFGGVLYRFLGGLCYMLFRVSE